MTADKKEGEAYTYGERLCKADYTFDLPYNADKDKWMENLVVNMDNDDYWDNEKIIFHKKDDDGIWYVNQIEHVIWTYKNKGFRNNQMVLQVAQPSDCLLQDPPCLREIDTRIQDNKLSFIVYFRSWDLWAGLPSNLAGIQLLKEFMANEIGVTDGEMIALSKGLHLYDYSWEVAKISARL